MCPQLLLQTRALVCLVIFLGAAPHLRSQDRQPGGDDPWLVFTGTTSPDRRYAVAWGLPKHPELWAEICRSIRDKAQRSSEEDEKLADQIPAEDVENYIVDLREKKVLAGLQSKRDLVPNYYQLRHLRPNHHGLEILWSRAGEIVVVNHTYRSESVTFCAARIENGNAGSLLDLHKELQASLRSYMRKRAPRRVLGTDLDFLFENVEHRDAEKFTVDAKAEFLAKGQDGWNEEAVIVFTLKRAGPRDLKLEVLEIRQPVRAGQ